MEHLAQHIEGLIFTSEHPLRLTDIKSCLEETFEMEFSEEDLEAAISQLMERYQEDQYAFEVLAIGGGYQFLTKGAYHQSIGTLLRQSTKKRLSRAALETLSIVAYKQPVSKGELEKIRGVSCDYAVQKLLEKELVTILGRSDGPGRPLLYGTSEKFMDYFGLSDIKDLPKPKDFKVPDSEVGEMAPIEEELVTTIDEEGKLEEAITMKSEESGPGEEVVSGETPMAEGSSDIAVTSATEMQEANAEEGVEAIPTENQGELPAAESIQDETNENVESIEITENEETTYEATMPIEGEPEPIISETEMMAEMEKEEENMNTSGSDVVSEEE